MDFQEQQEKKGVSSTCNLSTQVIPQKRKRHKKDSHIGAKKENKYSNILFIFT
jgi:hypothetical protein